MAEILAIAGYVQQAYSIYTWFRQAYKGIKNAPGGIRNMQAEVKGLIACLGVISYPHCQHALTKASKEQLRDLDDILAACLGNAKELTEFVRSVEWLVTQTERSRDPNWFRRVLRKGGNFLKQAYYKYDFASTNKAPMRDRLAIPLQSMNIFLVSLTMVASPYQPSLASGPSMRSVPHHWAVIGNTIAFKTAKFDTAALKKPGVEEQISRAAYKIINGNCVGRCCPCCPCGPDHCHCDDNSKALVPFRSVSSSPLSRRKSTSGAQPISDKLYLVRSKSKARGRSKSVVRRIEREVPSVGDQNLGNPSGSSSFHGTRDLSSPRQSLRRRLSSPPRSTPKPRESSPLRRGRSAVRVLRPSTEAREYEEMHAHSRQRSAMSPSRIIAQAIRAGREEAIKGIQETRKRATENMARGVQLVGTDLAASRFSQDGGPPTPAGYGDVRAYIEIRFGFLVREASPNAERLARLADELEVGTDDDEHLRYHMHGVREDEGYASESSDVPDASDDEFCDAIGVQRHGISAPQITRIRQDRLQTMFSIPQNTDYIPRTTGPEVWQTERKCTCKCTDNGVEARHMGRTRTDDNLEWERLLNERDRTLQRREEILAMRERELRHRRSRSRSNSRFGDMKLVDDHSTSELRSRPSARTLDQHDYGMVRQRHAEFSPSMEVSMRDKRREYNDDYTTRSSTPRQMYPRSSHGSSEGMLLRPNMSQYDITYEDTNTISRESMRESHSGRSSALEGEHDMRERKQKQVPDRTRPIRDPSFHSSEGRKELLQKKQDRRSELERQRPRLEDGNFGRSSYRRVEVEAVQDSSDEG